MNLVIIKMSVVTETAIGEIAILIHNGHIAIFFYDILSQSLHTIYHN